mgnify:CR=1 FL=1
MSPVFDDRSDIAAVVYAPGDDPDAVLADLAARAELAGFGVAGILQHRLNDPRQPGRNVGFRIIVPGRAAASGAPAPLATAERCGDILVPALEQVSLAVRRKPDLLILSRFGRMELEGGGFLSVLEQAAVHEIPAVIAVPEAIFTPLRAFVGGLCVRLRCDRGVVWQWWERVGGSAPTRSGPATICALAK